VGRHIRALHIKPTIDFVVAGVVGNSKQVNVRETPAPAIYVPFYQDIPNWDSDFAFFVVRYSGSPAPVIAAIRKFVADDAANLPVDSMKTLDAVLDATLGQEHLLTQLSGFFGILAGVLACIGIYAIMSYTVARRIPEIGLRMALGAQRGTVILMILKECLTLVLIGAAIGVVGSVAASKLLAGLLYGLPSVDVLVLAATVTLMLLVALIASYVPAWRASRVDPLIALRSD
jgi:ABC-type antimicrobial peptide transport system permease subunit